MKTRIHGLLAIAFTALFSGQLLAHGNMDIITLRGETDSNGVFHIPHLYYTGTDECKSNTLVGANVAILQRGINTWYMQVDTKRVLGELLIIA